MFKCGKPEVLFKKAAYTYVSQNSLDISSDGKQFLMIKENGSSAGGPRKINIVLNWTEELKQRMPYK